VTALADELAWQRFAACASLPASMFYPKRGASTRAAKQICKQQCPVRNACLRYAVAKDERDGIWGGLSTYERDELVARNLRSRHNRDRTHCIRGHEFTPENTLVDPRGARRCRACKRSREAHQVDPRSRRRTRRVPCRRPPRPPAEPEQTWNDDGRVVPHATAEWAAWAWWHAHALGTPAAAVDIGLSTQTLYRLWDRPDLNYGRPNKPVTSGRRVW
jgi:WhiB family redox-sensing transcriptional regulator